mgnify:CR=1 FL=1
MSDFAMSGDDLEQMYQEAFSKLEESAWQGAFRSGSGFRKRLPGGKDHGSGNPRVLHSRRVPPVQSDLRRRGHRACGGFRPGAARYRTTGVGRSRLLHFTGQPFGDGGSGGRQNRDEAMELAGTFHKLMESRGKGLDDESAEESLEDGIVFQGVSKYPMRIKCALLGWEGMKDSVAKALAAKA